ncbi:hypothetical protein ACVS9P_01500 [Caproicibacterium sp. NSD3]
MDKRNASCEKFRESNDVDQKKFGLYNDMEELEAAKRQEYCLS